MDNNRVLEFDAPLATGHGATRVFGQLDLASNAPNRGGSTGPGTLWGPSTVALDSFGNLYVADYLNNRVLEYNDPLADPLADRVFGQPDFTHSAADEGGSPSASNLNQPKGVALDQYNNLYVADAYNNRVLEFDWAKSRLYLPLARR